MQFSCYILRMNTNLGIEARIDNQMPFILFVVISFVFFVFSVWYFFLGLCGHPSGLFAFSVSFFISAVTFSLSIASRKSICIIMVVDSNIIVYRHLLWKIYIRFSYDLKNRPLVFFSRPSVEVHAGDYLKNNGGHICIKNNNNAPSKIYTNLRSYDECQRVLSYIQKACSIK